MADATTRLTNAATRFMINEAIYLIFLNGVPNKWESILRESLATGHDIINANIGRKS